MGDVASFEDFYAEHRDRLVAALAATGTEVHLAADAVDEAMARALERWDRISSRDEPAARVFATARNHNRRRFRLPRRRPDLPPSVTLPPAGETWLVVGALSPRQREVVALRYLGGLTEPAIAELLGISRGTVSSTLRDALRRLRSELLDPTEEPT